jgi:hypothetical protein
MKESSGADYEGGDYFNLLAVSYAKVGKTVKLVADSLGVFPGQKFGGLVDTPENLHVIAVDNEALGGIQDVLLESCGAPKESLGFRVYNMQQDVMKLSQDPWDFTIFNTLITVRKLIQQRIAKGGVHCVIMSSLTTIGATIKRAIAGDAASKQQKGSGMDMAKWDALGMQLNEIRIAFQALNAHVIWEGHVFKPQGEDQNGAPSKKESLQLQGSTGQNFPNNVGQILRLHRMFGERLPGTKMDKVVYDTQPELEFLIGGRAFNERLDPKETDLTLIAHKLGRKIGRWNAPKKK